MFLVRNRLLLAVCVCSFAACFPTIFFSTNAAQAQGWLAGRDKAEGPGFRVGNLELHPGLGAEVGYDSNVFLSDDDGLNKARGNMILRLTPHLYLSTIGPQRAEEEGKDSGLPLIDFRTGVSGTLYHYFETTNSPKRTNVELNVDSALTFFPGRPVSVALSGGYQRTIRPFTEAGAASDNYSRSQVNGGAKLVFQSRGGVLKAGLGYNIAGDLFEGDSFNFANSLQHKISADTSWSFLPSTALLYDSELNFVTFSSDKVDSGTVQLADSTRFRTRVGLNGAVTQVISVLGMVGYGAGWYDTGDDYDNLVAQAQLKFAFTRAVTFSLGYDRDFSRSFIGNFYRRDRGSAKLQLLLLGAWLIGIDGGVGLYTFGQTFANDPTMSIGNSFDRDDIRVDANLFTEFRLTDWLALNATFSYMGNFTDFKFGQGTAFDPAGYNRWNAWAGVRVFY